MVGQEHQSFSMVDFWIRSQLSATWIWLRPSAMNFASSTSTTAGSATATSLTTLRHMRCGLRVGDAVAVLDELAIERAHFIGLSWGGRLCFGIGEHAPQRALSLCIGGQQPYRWPDTALTRVITEGLIEARTQGMEGLIQAMEAFWEIRFPEALRARYLDNDPAALQTAWTKALAEGAVSENLPAWRVRCLIFMGAGDTDFLEQARRAATQLPNAEFISLAGLDHIGAHMGQGDPVIEAVLRTLRADGP